MSSPDYKRRYKIVKTTELKALAFAMALFASLPFMAACAQTSVSRAEAQNWEAKVPPGAETDPIALNITFGKKDILNRSIVESLKNDYEIKPYAFAGLKPKAANDGIFEVSIKRGVEQKWRPDMGGIGPFYLVKAGTNYYAITRRNLAQLFSPIEKKSEVLSYLGVFQSLFGNKFAHIVTADADTEKEAHVNWPTKPKPPKFTEVTELKDGFRVTLVTYTHLHIEAFFEKTVHVGRDGVVNEEKPEQILKKIGDGIRF